ncbi:AAA ATPase-like protein [Fragilaria crotonensis]|nr:AAA ATPase-like protein [Fragilaria crotonensis]
MENKFIPDAIEIISKAIEADNAGEYEKALNFYRDALGRFTIGIKYEKNEARRKLVMERVDGYMKRAEELRDYINAQHELDKNGGGGSATKARDDKNGEDDDAEKNKMRGALQGAIITEKPNVKWEDVAGLDAAKDFARPSSCQPDSLNSLLEIEDLSREFFSTAPRVQENPTLPRRSQRKLTPPSFRFPHLTLSPSGRENRNDWSEICLKWPERPVRPLSSSTKWTLCGSRRKGNLTVRDELRRSSCADGRCGQNTEGKVLVLGATNVPWELDAAIRRRFEKRVYIPLPDAESRAFMFKLHLGDTPSDLVEHDYEKLGKITKGASGSDIKVLVKEALMEPLRRCQQAKQFYRDSEGYMIPCAKYPNCAYCPPKLSSDPKNKNYECSKCGAITINLWDVPPEKLKAPEVKFKDFETVLGHAFSSVSPEELKRFVEWTKQFGQDGA